jgi:uncharacterized protein
MTDNRDLETVQYKLSDYVDIVKMSSNQHILFSGLTGFISVISPSISTLLKNNKINKLNQTNIEYFIRNGVLVQNNVDEKEILRQIVHCSHNINMRTKNITLIITRNCNCKCSYCYQKGKSTTISSTGNQAINKNQISSIISYAKQISDENELNVIFFGGEPLLEFKLIRQLIDSFRLNFSYIKNLKFIFITNGTLIDNDFLNIFKEHDDLALVQITFDGLKHTHDNIRQLKNGKGTYDLILGKLSKLVQVADNIKVRINVSKENLCNIEALYEFLIDTFPSDKLVPYLAPVRSLNYSSVGNQLSPEDFWGILRKFYDYYFKSTKKNHPSSFPKIKYKPCPSLFSLPNWIGANNILYQCQHQPDVSHPPSGFLDIDGNLDFHPINVKMFDKLIVRKCISCKVFAFCGGPCFADLFNEEPFPFHCSYVRNSIIHYVKSLKYTISN